MPLYDVATGRTLVIRYSNFFHQFCVLFLHQVLLSLWFCLYLSHIYMWEHCKQAILSLESKFTQDCQVLSMLFSVNRHNSVLQISHTLLYWWFIEVSWNINRFAKYAYRKILTERFASGIKYSSALFSIEFFAFNCVIWAFLFLSLTFSYCACGTFFATLKSM